MRRRKRQAERVNHDRWLVSYADFITLLFAFFVVMYSTSSVNEGKMRVLSDTMMAAFSNPAKSLSPIQVGELLRSPKPSGTSPVTIPVLVAPKHDPGEGLDAGAGRGRADIDLVTSRVNLALDDLIKRKLVNVRRGDNALEVEFKSSILYASGGAHLNAAAIPMLTEFAGILKGVENLIRVEGFTDNIPIHSSRFPSNWELSAARAASVVHLFMQAGVAPQRMAAIGYSEYRPIALNNTAEQRARNRRVVVVLPDEEYPPEPLKAVEQVPTEPELSKEATDVSPANDEERPSTKVRPEPELPWASGPSRNP